MAANLSGMAAANAVRVLSEVPVTATDLRRADAYNSPVLAADPAEPRFLALAHRADAPEFGCGLEVSGDAGRAWVRADPVPELPTGAERCYAPEIAFDGHGRLYFLFIGLQGPGNSPMGVFLTSSSDKGRTFSSAQPVLGPQNYMVRMAIDPSVGDRGRIHLVWLRAGADPSLGGLPAGAANPIVAAYSDNAGQTFSEPVPVSDPSRPRAVAPAVAVAVDGAVHVAYYDLGDDAVDYQGLGGGPWPGQWSLVVATSTDRGRRFEPGVVVDDKLVPPGRVMLIFTMPPPAIVTDSSDRVFTAWPDARNGDPDVFLSRSSDAGRSWAPLIRLNDDPAKNGADQSLVRLSVAGNGRVDAVFFDRRNDPEDFLNDTYLTYSTDGGRRFAPNVKLTSQPSDSRVGQGYVIPSAKGLTELGSRLALISRPNAALAAWPDSRNYIVGEHTQQVLATEVVLGGEGSGGIDARTGIIVGGGVVLLAAAALVVRRRQGAR